MYKVSVPVMNKTLKRSDREKLTAELNKLNAKRIFLAIGEYHIDAEKRKEEFTALEKNIEYFKQKGFEVGVWLWAFMITGDKNYTHMKGIEGVVCQNNVCPSDSSFRLFAAEYIKQIAECGAELIMFDDDYRYSFLECGMACVCEKHLQYMRELLNEGFEAEDIKDKLISGGKNKYRSAWLEANRHFLIKFAKEMREAVNSVNPEIRLGVCACMGTWDYDGASAIEISKALAGNTKPFLRLIGAPYWAVNKGWGNRLQDVIELERMECAWCAGEDIEIMAEGDVYPRPRYQCPSSYLEGFDTALRADGILDGILKYALDYVSTDRYETGYVRGSVKNKEAYEKIKEMFENKQCVGVRVFEAMKKFENMEVLAEVRNSETLQNIFFSPAARMMSACQIPTVYRGNEYGIAVFGENAEYLSEEAISRGLILDMRAAEILTGKGIDVGLRCIKGKCMTREEHFLAENEYINLTYDTPVYEIETDKTAVIESEFLIENKTIPASFAYENSKGERFLVFAFDAYFCNEALYRQYARARQLQNSIFGLCGRKLPASFAASPDVYIICKKGESSLSIGLWNFFADPILEYKIELEKNYKNIKIFGAEAEYGEKEIVLPEIKAYEFVFVELSD